MARAPLVTASTAWALLTLLLLGVYHTLRFAAAQCLGGGCEAYIPLSALIPLVTWLAGVATGIVALRSNVSARRRVLGGMMLLTLVGPIFCLLVFRDRPDLFVLFGTLCVAITPLTVLLYSPTAGRSPPSR